MAEFPHVGLVMPLTRPQKQGIVPSTFTSVYFLGTCLALPVFLGTGTLGSRGKFRAFPVSLYMEVQPT